LPPSVSEFFSYKPQSKLVGFGNYKPRVRGTDEGIWRRIHLVPFNAVITEQTRDVGLLEKLKAELPGILAWAVRGCLEWQRFGLTPPHAVLEAVKDYREQEDVFQCWLNECCILDPSKRTPAAELMASFKEYSGWRTISDRKFGDMLREKGFSKQRSNGMHWTGISLDVERLEPLPSFLENTSKEEKNKSLLKVPSNVPTVPESLKDSFTMKEVCDAELATDLLKNDSESEDEELPF